MAKKKTAGVKKIGDRQFMIDTSVMLNGVRVHIKKKGFSTAQEASEALPELIERKRKETLPYVCPSTFSGLCEEYLKMLDKKSKPQTIEAIRYMIGKHILPSFRGLKANEALTEHKVRHWYLSKASSNKDSAARKNKVFAVMRGIIEFAWRSHCITSETYQDICPFVENVRLPNRAKSNKNVWTYEQEQAFLSAIPQDSIDYPMFSLFCYLGCRLGEFQALQWKCFNPSQKTIAIGQQVIRLRGGYVVSDELKTNESYRINQLDDATFDLLLRYRSTLNSSDADEYIFPSPLSTRTPLSRTAFRKKFNRYIALSGVPKIVPHGVRKSKATMIAGVCQNAEEVAVGAKFLGHSPSMFMGTYVSQTGVQQSELVSRIAKENNRA